MKRLVLLVAMSVGIAGCGLVPGQSDTGKTSGGGGSDSGPDISAVGTKPPQELVQVLMGEARGQIASEVKATAPDYRSVTAEAVGAVIRNRIDLIDERNSPGFFQADPALYASDPSSSKYRAVIEARSASGVPQFNATDPRYESYDAYTAAAERETVDDDLKPAYDQAFIAASGIYDRSIDDPTGGAFGFFTPTAAQYERIDEALRSETTTLPANAGKSDASYPALAPIQFLVLEGAAPKSSKEPYPAFVFVRSRSQNDPAVVEESP